MIDREAFHQAMEVFYLGNGTGGVAAATLRAAITAYLTHAGEGAVPVAYMAIPTLKRLSTASDGMLVSARKGKDRVFSQPVYAAPHPTRQYGAREGEAIHQWRLTRGPISQVWHDGPLPEFALESERALFEFETRTLYTTPPAPDEVVEAEREACAKVVENTGTERWACGFSDPSPIKRMLEERDLEIVAKIRARSHRDGGGGV